MPDGPQCSDCDETAMPGQLDELGIHNVTVRESTVALRT